MRDFFRRCFALFLSFMVFGLLSLPSFAADFSRYSETNNNRQVKVGFYYAPGYHEMDENGLKSGYGFELMEKLSLFTGWDIEYVGYDKSWSDMFGMLKSGEIDLLSCVNWSEGRGVQYAFSDYNIGTSAVTLSCRADDERYATNSFYTFRGASIGFVRNDISYDHILSYATNRGFSFNPVFFDTYFELEKALKQGDVDMIGSTSFRVRSDEKLLASFDEESNYIIANKDNEELIHEVDSAILELLSFEPDVFADMADRYFGIIEQTDTLFTREEREYIEARSDRPVKTVICSDNSPFAYVENGEIVGIIPDYLRIISQNTGLSFEMYGVENEYLYENAVSDFSAEIRLDSEYNYKIADYYGYKLSIPYFKTALAMVFKGDSPQQSGKFGVVHKNDPGYVFDDAKTQSDLYIVYQSLPEAVLGLAKNEADYLVMPYYSAQNTCAEYEEYSLDFFVIDDSEMALSFGLFDGDDILLGPILNKAIQSIDSSQVQEIVSRNMLVSEKKVLSLTDLFKMYSWLPWAVLLFFLALIATIIILLYKAHASKREHMLAMENIAYFKSILLASIFAIKAEISDTIVYRIYYSNDSAPSGIGITEKVLTQRDLEDYRNRVLTDDLDNYDRIFSKENMLNLVKNNLTDYIEIRCIDATGKYSYVSVSAHSMPAYDSSECVLFVFKDIDASKKEEEEKRKTIMLALETAKRYNDSKTRFMSQMSHDIRTPLNAIVGMSTIAKMNMENTGKVEECLDIIDDSSDHLLALVNDILDMTKIESGKLSFSNKRVRVTDVLKKSVNMFTARVRNSNIEFAVDYSNVNHQRVVTDPTRLEQVFSNVISNSVKYTPQGGKISVTFREVECDEPGKYRYEFLVEDTGIGMDEDTLAKLFNPFERAEAVGYMEGAGLGMSITKNIIDALGGAITVDSKLGFGTKVKVVFSFSDEIKNSLAEIKELSGEKALIVSEDKLLKDLLTAIFKEGNMKVDSIDNVSSTYDDYLKESNGYKVVAVSLSLPVDDEMLILKQIRTCIGDDAVLFDITAEEHSTVGELKNDFKFDGFVSIPCYKNNVIRVISDGLDSRRNTKKNVIKSTAFGKHALIVEDVEINAIFAQAIAEMKGFESDVAGNGEEAVRMMEASDDGYYSIILMDIQMPVMNGYEATKLIRASEREYLKKIPIIAMSANTFDEDIQRCKEAGMDDHIAKPVDINRFSELVDIFVKGNN